MEDEQPNKGQVLTKAYLQVCSNTFLRAIYAFTFKAGCNLLSV